MRRQKTKTAALIMVLAVLIAAVAFVRVPAQTGKEDVDNHAAREGQEHQFVQVDAGSQIEEITVENTECSYTIEVQDDTDMIRGFPEDKLDRGKLEKALDGLLRAALTEDLGNQEDLLQFGLGEDDTRFTVVCQDGATQEFRIGNMLTGREDACYAILDNRVCVVEGFPQELCEGRRAFYKLELIAVAPKMNENGENADSMDYLRLGGSHFREEISVVQSEETGSGYLMEEPVYGEAMFADTDTAAREVSILDSLAYVEAASMVCENADADEIKECGLEIPYAFAEYSLNGEEHNIRVSSVCDDGTRYLMLDEDPAVYSVEDIRVNAWAEADVADLRTSYIWLVDVAGLDALVLTGRSGRYEYRMVRENGDSAQEFQVYCGEEELDVRGSFLPFYQKLLGMTILNTEKPSTWEEEPDYTISYIYGEQEGKENVTIEFYREHDKERYAAFLNGRFAGVLRADTVEKTMELADKVNADGEGG